MRSFVTSLVFILGLAAFGLPAHAAMQDFPIVKLRSLDKLSARTMTFEAKVGSTVKFGTIYIKVQACRKAEPIDQPESAAFLQIWEVAPKADAKWIFSGWMFASSPALSPMDHPVYDVWVLDCLEPPPPEGEKTQEQAAPETDDKPEPEAGSNEVE